MRRGLKDQLQRLNYEMVLMGSLIERAVETAGELLETGDIEVAQVLKAGDEAINRKEREIEAMCMSLMLMQPDATDLRFISAALKMITDMERIADQASDIAEILTMPHKGERLPFPSHLREMAKATSQMVHLAVEAYVRRDYLLARRVMQQDDAVDELFEKVKSDILKMLDQSCCNGEVVDGQQLLDMLMIAKYLERSADHAVNIAEWVEYALTGKHKGTNLQRPIKW